MCFVWWKIGFCRGRLHRQFVSFIYILIEIYGNVVVSVSFICYTALTKVSVISYKLQAVNIIFWVACCSIYNIYDLFPYLTLFASAFSSHSFSISIIIKLLFHLNKSLEYSPKNWNTNNNLISFVYTTAIHTYITVFHSLHVSMEIFSWIMQ